MISEFLNFLKTWSGVLQLLSFVALTLASIYLTKRTGKIIRKQDERLESIKEISKKQDERLEYLHDLHTRSMSMPDFNASLVRCEDVEDGDQSKYDKKMVYELENVGEGRATELTTELNTIPTHVHRNSVVTFIKKLEPGESEELEFKFDSSAEKQNFTVVLHCEEYGSSHATLDFELAELLEFEDSNVQIID